MTNSNNNTTFRSKFEKEFVTDENRPVIEAAFKKFCSLDPNTTDALYILWDLTYDPKVSSATLQKLGLNAEIIPPEKVSKLRSVLQYKYGQLHAGYFTSDVSEECKAAFEALSKNADSIVAAVVNNHCFYRMYLDDLDRTLGLLENPLENKFFGGLRMLGFTWKEAVYLKPFHIEIYNLLKAMCVHRQNDNSAMNTPFVKLGDFIEGDWSELPFTFREETQVAVEPETLVEAPVEAPADTTVQAPVEAPIEAPNGAQAEQPAETNSGFKALTPDAILEHKDVFTTFMKSSDMNLLPQIGKLGFDLNKVISKKEAISKVLEASAKMDEVNKLLQEIEDLKESSKSTMFEASKALND